MDLRGKTGDRLQCQVCGIQIPPGGIFSGSDGILPDSAESGDRLIEMALKDIMKGKSEQELMEEVYQEIKLILCGRCRLSYRDTILDMVRF